MNAIRAANKILKSFSLLIFMLAGCVGAETLVSDGSASSIQQIHDQQAHDGDTITVPSGRWTVMVTITKGVTLAGETTVQGAGTAEAAATDKSIVQDDTPSGGAMLKLAPSSPDKHIRVTGLTFEPGDRTSVGQKGINVLSRGKTPFTALRIDHCHFKSLRQANTIGFDGWVYGVIDHNIVEYASGFAFVPDEAHYGGPPNIQGMGAWADYSWYGTDKFLFIETNTVRYTGTGNRSAMDTTGAARYVYRYNYNENASLGDHGTEGGARLVRCREIYHTHWHWTVTPPPLSFRGGGMLIHNNTWDGLETPNDTLAKPSVFRANSSRSTCVWGQADGNSMWDQNDTDGEGHFVEGQPAHVFAQGTATGGTVDGQTSTLIDTGADWQPHQWVGYSVVNTNPASTSNSYNLGSYIVENDRDTITYNYYAATDTLYHLQFREGDSYKITRCLRALDQTGTGKGDLINSGGTYNDGVAEEGSTTWKSAAAQFWFWDQRLSVTASGFLPGGVTTNGVESADTLQLSKAAIASGSNVKFTLVYRPVNTLHGNVPYYPHQIAEPSFEWNNTYTPNGHAYLFRTDIPFIIEGRDFFNLGDKHPADTTPQEVKDALKASVNGEQYEGTFTYPHPLVSQVSPTPTPTISPTPAPSLSPTPTPSSTLPPTPTPSATSSVAPMTVTITIEAPPNISVHVIQPASKPLRQTPK